MDAKALKGVELTPYTYTPRSIPRKTAYPPYKDRLCQGFLMSIQNKEEFLCVGFTLSLIKTLKTHYPDQIKVITDRLDNLFGNEWLSLYIRDQLSYEQLCSLIKKDEETFRQQRKPYLLY
jgi:uncharacterized protein YbbC (DUF1343 family)